MSFVIILEYVLTEFLDLSYDIPTLIIINIFFDIIHNPEKQTIGIFKTFYKFINGMLFYLIVIEFYP